MVADRPAMQSEPSRPEWDSRLGFILASIGGAVGLGNIWRFSYVAYEGGGGTFLIIYFLALITTALPLVILEYGIGHRMRQTAPFAFESIRRGGGFFGWLGLATLMVVTVFYMVVLAWCLNYLVLAFNAGWGADPRSFFETSFLHQSGRLYALGAPVPRILLALAALWALNWLVTSWGLQKGLERASKILMPILFVLAVALVVRGATLPGAGEGIRWFLRPRWESFGNPEVWFLAFTQIFFSASLCQAILVNFGSFLSSFWPTAASRSSWHSPYSVRSVTWRRLAAGPSPMSSRAGPNSHSWCSPKSSTRCRSHAARSGCCSSWRWSSPA
jgi:NSS family neurotransmitter:Na+ symporter